MKVNRLKKGKFSLIRWWGAVAIVILSVFAFFGDDGLVKLYRMHKKEIFLKKEIGKMKKENERLAREIKKLDDPAYIEKTVREELGLLHPDEVIFFIRENDK